MTSFNCKATPTDDTDYRIFYLICQKAKPVLVCFPKHTIQKQTNKLRVKGQNNYTEQLQKQYSCHIQSVELVNQSYGVHVMPYHAISY